MTKKDLARILILHKKGFDRKMCIQAIIETEKSSYLAAQAIEEFMFHALGKTEEDSTDECK